jgi:hypothetical protein
MVYLGFVQLARDRAGVLRQRFADSALDALLPPA